MDNTIMLRKRIHKKKKLLTVWCLILLFLSFLPQMKDLQLCLVQWYPLFCLCCIHAINRWEKYSKLFNCVPFILQYIYIYIKLGGAAHLSEGYICSFFICKFSFFLRKVLISAILYLGHPLELWNSHNFVLANVFEWLNDEFLW